MGESSLLSDEDRTRPVGGRHHQRNLVRLGSVAIVVLSLCPIGYNSLGRACEEWILFWGRYREMWREDFFLSCIPMRSELPHRSMVLTAPTPHGVGFFAAIFVIMTFHRPAVHKPDFVL